MKNNHQFLYFRLFFLHLLCFVLEICPSVLGATPGFKLRRCSSHSATMEVHGIPLGDPAFKACAPTL